MVFHLALYTNSRVGNCFERPPFTFANLLIFMAKASKIILCVDDDPDDQLMVQETIKDIDPTAVLITAMNGQEAIDHLRNAETSETFPCLIIMDINMPVMDGKEALAYLKKDERFAAIPVVMFTTSSSKLDRSFCEHYNIPFLTKPIRQTDLHLLVQKILAFGGC